MKNMNKSLERKQKKEEQLRKRQLVYELGELEKNHCKPCDKRINKPKHNPKKICEGCEIHNQIRAIGERLSPSNENEELYKNKKQKVGKNTIKSEVNDVPKSTVKATVSKPKVEEIVKVENIVQKQIEPDWKEVGKTLGTYFEKKNADALEDTEKLEMQYKIEKLERDIQLHKDTATKAVQELHLYTIDYRKLEVDFRNSEFKCKNLMTEVEDLKETVQLNHLLMRQHVKFLNRLDTVAVGEADNTWR